MRVTRQLTLDVRAADDGTGITRFDDEGSLIQVESGTPVALENDGVMAIAASGAKAVPFGDVTTAAIILLETDQELDLVFNGGAEILKLKPPSSGKSAMLYWEGVITSIQATNVSTTTAANVTYALVGV